MRWTCGEYNIGRIGRGGERVSVRIPHWNVREEGSLRVGKMPEI